MISDKPGGKPEQAVNLPGQPGQGGGRREQTARQDQDRLQLNFDHLRLTWVLPVLSLLDQIKAWQVDG